MKHKEGLKWDESLPAWECGLKYVKHKEGLKWDESLPAWECGLKSVDCNIGVVCTASLPAWECGLKCLSCVRVPLSFVVTPCAGVWIEIATRSGKVPGF